MSHYSSLMKSTMNQQHKTSFCHLGDFVSRFSSLLRKKSMHFPTTGNMAIVDSQSVYPQICNSALCTVCCICGQAPSVVEAVIIKWSRIFQMIKPCSLAPAVCSHFLSVRLTLFKQSCLSDTDNFDADSRPHSSVAKNQIKSVR